MTYSIISERKEERYIDVEIDWIDNETPVIETQYQFTTWTLVEFDFDGVKKIVDIPHFMTEDSTKINQNIEGRSISEINSL
jgi:hypothetical protein